MCLYDFLGKKSRFVQGKLKYPFALTVYWKSENFQILVCLRDPEMLCVGDRGCWLEKGPAGFLNKMLAGAGSLLTGLIRSVTEGYGLEVQREREEDYKLLKF